MKKQRLVILLMACAAGAASVSSAAERLRVTDIVFEKLERLNAAQMLLVLSMKVGDAFSAEEFEVQIERDIERLYRTGEFDSVGPLYACRREDFAGGVRVVIPVREKRQVAAVYISGGKAVGRKDLTKDLKTARGRLVADGDIEQDRQTLLMRCFSKGFFFAEVRVERKPLPRARLEVIYHISPGPRVRIHEIRFVGTRAVEAAELSAQMKTDVRDFWLFGLLRSGYFSPERLQEDVAQLRKYLRGAKGLLDATVGVEEIRFDESRERMYLTIRVEEGPVYKVKGFDVSVTAGQGREAHLTPQQILLEARAERFVGTPHRGTVLGQAAERVLARYREDGYLNARVTLEEPRVEFEGDEATAVLRVDEKDPVYARRIDIRGNHRSKDEVVRRELAFGPGDLVTLSKIRKSVSNLHKLQFFDPETVDIRPMESTATAEGTDFVVDSQDTTDGQLLLGVGVASDLGVMGSFALRKRNFDIMDWPSSLGDIPNSFTGAGQILNLEMQPGTRYSHYRLSFTEPYFMSRWWGLSISGSRNLSRRDTWEQKKWGGSLRFFRYLTFDRDIFLSFGYRYDDVDIGKISSDAPLAARDAEGTTRVSALSSGLTFNRYLFDPYAGPFEGYRLELEGEYAGGLLGTGVDFWRGEARAAYFVPLYTTEEGSRHVLAISGTFGWMEGHHDTTTKEIPIFERFFLGGPHSLRGFRYYGVGPHENGQEIGGTMMVHGTVEYGFPLFLKFLRGCVFFDWGQLEGSYVYEEGGVRSQRKNGLAMGRMRAAAGAGLRISLTPLGMPVPISLYWAEALSSRPEDRTRSFLFSIGAFGF